MRNLFKKGDNPNQRKVHSWARGFLIRGKKQYHPYTFLDEFKEEARTKNNVL